MPLDGGLFIPNDFEDMRRWILYTNSSTSFESIAGALTSAFLKDEFSPIICETIAVNAFKHFSPQIKKLDERLYALELFHTPTGSHKDFGISFLVNALETTLTLTGGEAIFLDASVGELGASLSLMMRGKKRLKAVLLYPSRPNRKIRGIKESDLIQNGGNIIPIEINGTEEDCHKIVRAFFLDRPFVKRNSITVANTANIGRLIPQSFFYPFAFSRLKEDTRADIFYAMSPGNYSNVVAGLYSWKMSLPLSGFICPTTHELKLDAAGKCVVMDGTIDFLSREKSDPASPSNLERLEEVFNVNSLMLKNFIFPSLVTTDDEKAACQELFSRFALLSDSATAKAYAAAKKREEITADEDSSVVLVMRDHPAISADYVFHTLGEKATLPPDVAKAFSSVDFFVPQCNSIEEVKKEMKKYGIE